MFLFIVMLILIIFISININIVGSHSNFVVMLSCGLIILNQDLLINCDDCGQVHHLKIILNQY